jgi:hypothetical protein
MVLSFVQKLINWATAVSLDRRTYVGLCPLSCTKICQVSNGFSFGLAVTNTPLVGVGAGLLLDVHF